jgi:DNA-binding GntR family transcriptional regulator
VLHRSSCGELDSLEYMPVSGETPPGEFQAAVPSRQLHEDRLAAELGVSRNSVREPSRALVATDRIEGIPSQSAYVVAATGPTWFTRLRVRSVLEAHTAELAA